jgi:hypothetical protein
MSTDRSKKYTTRLDQVSSTRLQWCSMFLTEAGLPNPKLREIIARSIDTYTELLEEMCINYSMNPKDKTLREELYQVSLLKAERSSAWNSLDLPKIDLQSFGSYPKYSTLAKQYHNPIKHNLPRIKPKKPKTTVSIKPKVPLPDPINDQPEVKLELTNCPDVGNVVYPSKTI